MLEFVGFSVDKKSILYVQNIKEDLNNPKRRLIGVLVEW